MWSQLFLLWHWSQWRWFQCQPSHILANNVIEGPLHIPTLWLWKINESHSFNLVHSKRLRFFFPLFQTWHGACRLSALARCWALEFVVSCGLPSCELTCYLLIPLPHQLLQWGVCTWRPGEQVNWKPERQNQECRGSFGPSQTRLWGTKWKCERLTLLHQHVNGLQLWIRELPPAITVVIVNSVRI